MPDTAVTNDFYRQALDLDLRGKREYTEAVLSAMGGIKKVHFSAIKSLLKLSDEAMELADRHGIEEFKLRHVVTVPAEYHSEILRQIINFNLTSKQVKELCEGDASDTDDADPLEKLPSQAVKMAKVTQSIQSTTPQDLARALLHQEGDAAIARARIQALQRLLSEADRFLASD